MNIPTSLVEKANALEQIAPTDVCHQQQCPTEVNSTENIVIKPEHDSLNVTHL